MSVQAYKILYQGQLGNTVATLATVPTGRSWLVAGMTAVNTDTSARTFGMCVGGTAAANRIMSDVISLPASGGYWTWGLEKPLMLETGQTIAGGASVATKVTVTIWGDEVS